MDTVLLVSGLKTAEQLGGLLVPAHFARLVHLPSAAKARRAAAQHAWGLVIVGAPLPDESAASLARDLAKAQEASVLLLDGELQGEQAAGSDGVITLEKPVNRSLFENTLQVLAAGRGRLARLQAENKRLALKLEETRLVGRAKCALVAYRQMTENEAHRYIEKQAMDGRLPRREVARDILRLFEGDG